MCVFACVCVFFKTIFRCPYGWSNSCSSLHFVRLFSCLCHFRLFLFCRCNKILFSIAILMRIFSCVSFHVVSCYSTGWRISCSSYTCVRFFSCVCHFMPFLGTQYGEWFFAVATLVRFFSCVCVISCSFMWPSGVKILLQ